MDSSVGVHLKSDLEKFILKLNRINFGFTFSSKSGLWMIFDTERMDLVEIHSKNILSNEMTL
jgi:hypothetical protein